MTDSDNADEDALKQAGVKDAEAIARHGVSGANQRLEVAMQQMERERQEAKEFRKEFKDSMQEFCKEVKDSMHREREEAKEFRKEVKDSMHREREEAKEFREELKALYDVHSRKTRDVVAIASLGGLITVCLYFAMPSEALKRLCGSSGMGLTALANVLRLYDFGAA